MTCRTEVMIQPISQQWAHIEEDYRINYISIGYLFTDLYLLYVVGYTELEN